MNCQVCFEQYDTQFHTPLVYSCGHTYCLACVEGAYKYNQYVCPTCRHVQTTTPTKNFAIIEILSLFPTTNITELSQEMHGLINEVDKQKQQMTEAAAENIQLKKDLKHEQTERTLAEEGRGIECDRKHIVIQELKSATHKLGYAELNVRRLEKQLEELKSQKERMEHWILAVISDREYYALIDGEYIKQDLEQQYQTAKYFVNQSEAYHVYPGANQVRDGKMVSCSLATLAAPDVIR